MAPGVCFVEQCVVMMSPVPPLTNIPVRIGVCLTAEDLFGAPTGIRECVEIMRTLDFRATVFRLTFVRHANDACFEGEPLNTAAALGKFALILSAITGPATLHRAMPLAQQLAGARDFHGFSDQALAATIEMAGAYCLRAGGKSYTDPGDLDSLSRVVFSFQGATFSPQFLRMAKGIPAWDAIPEKFLAEVIRNHLAHNALGSSGNAVARLYAFATDPRIAGYFQSRTNESLVTWFQRRLQMTPMEYLRASYLVGACAARYEQAQTDLASYGILEPVFLAQLGIEDRENVRRLLSLSKISADSVGHGRPIDAGLCEYLYGSVGLRIRPIIDMADCLLPTTFNGVLEKLIIGLPHILDEAARAIDPTVDIGLVRLKFGHLFERYLGVLLEDWLGSRADTRVLVGFRATPESPEWDAIVVHGNTAFCFEAKAKVFVLGMRTAGAFGALDQMLLNPIRDTYQGARRLLEAAQSENAPQQLRGIERIAPVLVVFDRVPIRFPYLDRYERHVEEVLGLPVFHPPTTSIMPIQTFEIEGVESWEEFIDMGQASVGLFEYLQQRSLDPLTRHDRKFPTARPTEWRTTNGPLRRFLDESAQMFQQLGRQITGETE